VIQSKPDLLDSAPPVERPAPAVKPGTPSWWVWIPYIWLFIVSTRSLSSWLSLAGQDGTVVDPDLSGSPVDSALLTLLIVLGLFVLGTRAEQTKRILGRNKWLIALFIYMTLSILWSNFPVISFRRSVRSMGTLVMVLVVLTEHNPLGAIRALLRRLYMVHIPLSILAIKYFRNIGTSYNWSGLEEMWIGLAVHKNNLGQVAMCSGLVSTWQVLQNWSRKKLSLDLLLLVLTLWVLRGSKNSHSSTAILGFTVGVAVLLGLQYVKKRVAQVKRLALLGTIALALLTPFLYLAFEAFDTTPVTMVLEATGRDMTLTGRTGLWKDLLNNAAKSPILGVGFGAFWVGHIGYAMYPLDNWSLVTPEWRPGEGHNGYIDVYVDLGVVGAALMLLVVGFAFAGALNDLQNEFELGRLRLTLLLSIVMNNVTESSFLKGTHSLWFVFLLVAVNVPTSTRRVRSRTARMQAITPHAVSNVSSKHGHDSALVGSEPGDSRRGQPRMPW
jgi:exopolysaccharide production protein ExoQ